jgi:hypothetical protein
MASGPLVWESWGELMHMIKKRQVAVEEGEEGEHIQKIAPHLQLPDDFFRARLTHGKCIVLLDGLDEVADPRQRARVAEAVAAFTQHHRDNRFVVSSRPRSHEGVAQQQLARPIADTRTLALPS